MLTCLSHKIEEMRKEYHETGEYEIYSIYYNSDIRVTNNIITFLGGHSPTNYYMRLGKIFRSVFRSVFRIEQNETFKR